MIKAIEPVHPAGAGRQSDDHARIDERQTTIAALIEGEQSGISRRRIPEILAVVKQESQKPGG